MYAKASFNLQFLGALHKDHIRMLFSRARTGTTTTLTYAQSEFIPGFLSVPKAKGTKTIQTSQRIKHRSYREQDNQEQTESKSSRIQNHVQRINLPLILLSLYKSQIQMETASLTDATKFVLLLQLILTRLHQSIFSPVNLKKSMSEGRKDMEADFHTTEGTQISNSHLVLPALTIYYTQKG
jgi:hypothetical protein